MTGADDDITPAMQPGEVWLVGAGPGDPGLLTLHAVNALKQAEVIVYDALVGERVLRLAPPDAVREYAGKRGGRPSPTQANITNRLIELARAGRRVLRLKGGDPFMFGRGGEEAAELAAAGVPVRIVPGITAGLGGLGLAGIPATTRWTNQAVIFATGHGAADSDAAPDWHRLGALDVPIILYMAIKTLPEIVAGLMAGGASAETPVAVLSHASLPDQRLILSCLGQVVAEVARQEMTAPAIVAIGSIVEMRERLLPTLRLGLWP